MAALGIPYEQYRWRDVSTLSGGEQQRLVLESLLRGTDGVLLFDEPDNYLDVPGKALAVTHDRWFGRSFERFLIFTADGDVREATESTWG